MINEVLILNTKNRLNTANPQQGDGVYQFVVHSPEDLLDVCRVSIAISEAIQKTGSMKLEFNNPADVVQFGEESIERSLRVAFKDLDLHRICVEVSTCEEEMINLYENAGFLRQVQRREATFFDGHYYDLISYDLLKPDWLVIHQQEVN